MNAPPPQLVAWVRPSSAACVSAVFTVWHYPLTWPTATVSLSFAVASQHSSHANVR